MKISFLKQPKITELGVLLLSQETMKTWLSGGFGGLKKLVRQEGFEGKVEQSLFLAGGFKNFRRFLLVGVGEKNETEKVRRAAAAAVKTAKQKKIEKVSFIIPKAGVLADDFAVAVVEASTLANYSFQKYKTLKEEKKIFLREIEVVGNLGKKEIEECRKAKLVCENANLCRDLVNDNSSTVNPDYVASFVRKHCKKAGLKVKVLDERELKKIGMNLVLQVGRGSESRPKVVVIEYSGSRGSKEKVLFVGKGITFDTGGLDLKPGKAMEAMRFDMAGAATVFGLLKSCAELKLKKNLVGILGLAENLVGKNSYRPGDVLTSMKGLSIENNSTDAEGRLVLADCIYFGAKKFRPKLVVDFSTLTGSAVRTFGDHVAFMCSTNDKAAGSFFESGLKTFERVWGMPLFEEYAKETRAERADLRSLNKRENNGAIFAACFLEKFTEKIPFVHLDIAGTAFLEEPKPYLEAGATGFGVRLAVEFLKNY